MEKRGTPRHVPRTLLLVLNLMVWTGFPAGPAHSDDTLPIINGKQAVATVDGDPVTLDDLNRAISASHASRAGGGKAGRIDYSGVITRLIHVKLIVLEARNIGLDQLPDMKRLMEDYRKNTLIEVLLDQQVSTVQADPVKVEELYQRKARRWRLQTYRFKTEKAVKEAREKIEKGASFQDVMAKAAQEGLAEGENKADVLDTADLNEPVARIVRNLKEGEVSPIISIGQNGFILFKLEGTESPKEENASARKEAEMEVLNEARVEDATKFYKGLEEKYVETDEALLKSLDFEAKEPGFAALLEDRRVLARIEGEPSITVADLAQALKADFYHGIEIAKQGKMVNKKKSDVLGDMIQRRVLLKEAHLMAIEKADAYTERVDAYAESSLFGAFVRKVIAPDIRYTEKDLKKYYKKHTDTFSTPKMLRIRSVAFGNESDARNALGKLKKGVDFNWLRSNAERRLDPGTRGLLVFEGKVLSVDGLDADLRDKLEDAQVGEYAMYESPAGHFYVLYVYDVIEPNTRPYESVQREIAERVFDQKVNEELEDWTKKLKKYYPVEVFRKDLKG